MQDFKTLHMSPKHALELTIRVVRELMENTTNKHEQIQLEQALIFLGGARMVMAEKNLNVDNNLSTIKVQL